jgi:hypothetical protein
MQRILLLHLNFKTDEAMATAQERICRKRSFLKDVREDKDQSEHHSEHHSEQGKFCGIFVTINLLGLC